MGEKKKEEAVCTLVPVVPLVPQQQRRQEKMLTLRVYSVGLDFLTLENGAVLKAMLM